MTVVESPTRLTRAQICAEAARFLADNPGSFAANWCWRTDGYVDAVWGRYPETVADLEWAFDRGLTDGGSGDLAGHVTLAALRLGGSTVGARTIPDHAAYKLRLGPWPWPVFTQVRTRQAAIRWLEGPGIGR